MSDIYEKINDMDRKLDRVLSLLEEVGLTTTEILAEKNGFRLMRMIGAYGAEYVVETPTGERYAYARLRTARRWFEKFTSMLE